MIKWLTSVFVLCIFSVNAQELEISTLHFQNYLETSKSSSHSHIRPSIRLSNSVFDKKPIISINKKLNNWSAKLNPIIMTMGGINKSSPISSTLGVGIDFSISNSKWALFVKYLPYNLEANPLRKEFNSKKTIDYGTSTFIDGNWNQRMELILAYQPNEFFNFSTGIGKHFFGNGYRSLLLSDNSAAAPFFNFSTEFGPIKYVNLYNVWTDFYGQTGNDLDKKTKLSAMHMLSWDITKKFNLSVFETVVWQAKDTLVNRFFEPNYLNPFVFYRPVEYAQGSADNVLLGLNMAYKPMESITLYYQLILDEFLLSELKAGKKWWANKYGMQLGLKTNDFLIDQLYFQTELNFVRPFTYSHKQSLQAYSNANSPVSHPLGANFFEILAIVSYRYNLHQFTLKSNYFGIGIDTDSISYGQDVLKSYVNREGKYGHTIMQGEKHNIINIEFIYDYKIKAIKNTYFTSKYRFRSDKSIYGNQVFHFVEIGFRTRIWNVYDDI